MKNHNWNRFMRDHPERVVIVLQATERVLQYASNSFTRLHQLEELLGKRGTDRWNVLVEAYERLIALEK